MIACETCALEAVKTCAFVVTFARYREGWLFSRHRARDTWETQGGHVDPGETPEAAARRELYEESGAVPRSLTPICGYWAERDGRRRHGVVFLGDIDRLSPLPPSEMAEVRWFAALPESLTYPQITPILFARVSAYLAQKEMDA